MTTPSSAAAGLPVARPPRAERRVDMMNSHLVPDVIQRVTRSRHRSLSRI